jgi:hypothetical protein
MADLKYDSNKAVLLNYLACMDVQIVYMPKNSLVTYKNYFKLIDCTARASEDVLCVNVIMPLLARVFLRHW